MVQCSQDPKQAKPSSLAQPPRKLNPKPDSKSRKLVNARTFLGPVSSPFPPVACLPGFVVRSRGLNGCALGPWWNVKVLTVFTEYALFRTGTRGIQLHSL
jgi:hypothetical protein